MCIYFSCFAAVAGPVRSLTAVGQNEDTLIVTWSAPLQPNGRITQYTVSVFLYDGSGPIHRQTITARDELRRIFSTDLGEFLCMLVSSNDSYFSLIKPQQYITMLHISLVQSCC